MTDTRNAMRQVLIGLNDQVKPIHEWLDGQRSYFAGQGYTPDEARAMAAAEFVSIFGVNIPRGGTGE